MHAKDRALQTAEGANAHDRGQQEFARSTRETRQVYDRTRPTEHASVLAFAYPTH